MKRKIIFNDIKNNRLLNLSALIFMAVSAFLFALTAFLGASLGGSMNTLMEKAKTPDYLQMHAGEIDREQLKEFASQNNQVEAYQILNFLNIENTEIVLNGTSLADSTQDNGVSVQSKKFDYLLDLDNEMIQAKENELYVPVCYRSEYGLHKGDTAEIAGEEFVIAGFLRDSQMNSMMASSKRFLISEEMYSRLLSSGSEEYLIEFLLNDTVGTSEFAADYTNAGLPMNGPAVTRPLIIMMNAISGGMLVLVILLVSVVVSLIAMLCIRFILLAGIKNDRKEIGMLKAVGISGKSLKMIYYYRYLAISAAGAVIGLTAAFFLRKPLQKGMQELYGPAENGFTSFILAAAATAVIEGILLFSISRVLKQTEKMTVVKALENREEGEERKSFARNVLVAFVIAAGVFLMTVPQNLYSTISSPEFVTYMGIGDGEIRLDIRQADDITAKTLQTEELLKADERVENFTVLCTKSYPVALSDGTYGRLNVEQGDHETFPVSYIEGTAPDGQNEIALSYLCAKEYDTEIGGTVRLAVAGKEDDFTVCGIYSDITNGGKTAKTLDLKDSAPVMWSVLYVALSDNVSNEQWILEYEKKLDDLGISVKTVDIADYVEATYGQTMKQIRLASVMAAVVAVPVIIIVVFLFIRLLMAEDRNEISFKKAIGLTEKRIMSGYGKKYLLLSFAGILAGILFGNLLGERIAGAALQSLGAAGVRFIIDKPVVYLGIPALALGAAGLAIFAGIREIKRISAVLCSSGQ